MPGQSDLKSFIFSGQSSWSASLPPHGYPTLQLKSGPWQGMDWEHELVFVGPKTKDVILVVTGYNANLADLQEAERWSAISGLGVATLFHQPNQPLDDRFEDELIAHTLVKYEETGDPSWPLLGPMVRSTFHAMDALQEWSHGEIQRFIVTGVSKRGWTSWLVGSMGDPRVIGIAPVVFDMLNVPCQFQRQAELFGAPSEMVKDYTAQGIDQELGTSERLGELVEMLDPWSYRDRLTLPTLAVIGSNDRYWATDATSFYLPHMPRIPSLLTIPNAGHVFHGELYDQGIGNFAACVAAGVEFPRWTPQGWEGFDDPEVLHYVAISDTLDFRDSEFRTVKEVEEDPKQNMATFALAAGEIKVGNEERRVVISSPTTVHPARKA